MTTFAHCLALLAPAALLVAACGGGSTSAATAKFTLMPGLPQVAIQDIWGTSANDVWAVAGTQFLYHWDGSAWTNYPVENPNVAINGVWGRAPNDYWAVGDGGRILHWDGSKWSKTVVGNYTNMAVWGAAANDVWIVGGANLHWDGAAWTIRSYGGAGLAQDVFGGSASELFSVGWGSVGFANQPIGTAKDMSVPTQNRLYGVWAASPTDAWAVGSGGDVIRYDGTSWKLVSTGMAGVFRTVYGLAANDVWVAGTGPVVHWDGSGWTKTDRAYTVEAIWAASPTDLWLATGEGVMRGP